MTTPKDILNKARSAATESKDPDEAEALFDEYLLAIKPHVTEQKFKRLKLYAKWMVLLAKNEWSLSAMYWECSLEEMLLNSLRGDPNSAFRLAEVLATTNDFDLADEFYEIALENCDTLKQSIKHSRNQMDLYAADFEEQAEDENDRLKLEAQLIALERKENKFHNSDGPCLDDMDSEDMDTEDLD